MQLTSIQYEEYVGGPQEWKLEGLQLGLRNLIVGKNATGKTRTLNVISGVARHILSLMPIGSSGNSRCQFNLDGKIVSYEYSVELSSVVSEKLTIDNRIFLERGKDGIGEIWAEELTKMIKFQSPPTVLAASSRRDSIQHPFLEPLHKWADGLRHYNFGTQFGKDAFAIQVKGAPAADPRDPNMLVGLFKRAEAEFGAAFIARMLADLKEVGYESSSIEAGPLVSAQLYIPQGEVVGLRVRELGLPGVTDQITMSAGMFRVVALLTHINYCQLSNTDAAVLIDDIGEGLDFDRSCRVIDLLRRKSDESRIQLIMSSNDRFVMNSVPLEEWSVLNRLGNVVKVQNYQNSREAFEAFRFTGLSNFSLLETDYLNSSIEKIH